MCRREIWLTLEVLRGCSGRMHRNGNSTKGIGFRHTIGLLQQVLAVYWACV